MEIITVNENDILEKKYILRKAGMGGHTVLTGIPPSFIMREAKRNNITRDEFIEQFQAVCRYNSFNGLHILFERKTKYRKELEEKSV